jgi:hypothetical protein
MGAIDVASRTILRIHFRQYEDVNPVICDNHCSGFDNIEEARVGRVAILHIPVKDSGVRHA